MPVARRPRFPGRAEHAALPSACSGFPPGQLLGPRPSHPPSPSSVPATSERALQRSKLGWTPAPSPMRLLAGRATSPPPPPLATCISPPSPPSGGHTEGDTASGEGAGRCQEHCSGCGTPAARGPLEPPPPLPDPCPLSRAAPAPPGSRDPSPSAASVHFWPGAASRAALSPPVRLGGHGPCGAAVPAPQR